MMLANGTKISDEIEKMMNSMSLRNAIFFFANVNAGDDDSSYTGNKNPPKKIKNRKKK